MSGWRSAERRVLELLADEAAFGLERCQRRELDILLEQMPDFDVDCIERAAGVVVLGACSATIEPMPRRVRQRIRDEAREFFKDWETEN